MPVGSVGAVASQTGISTDPRDLNGDGKVTAAEAQTYALRHAQPKAAEASKAQPSDLDPTATPGRIDLYA